MTNEEAFRLMRFGILDTRLRETEKQIRELWERAGINRVQAGMQTGVEISHQR